LKFVDKEGLEINENYVSVIILVPYYLVLFWEKKEGEEKKQLL
jgi:hypothetical protein